MRYSRGASCDPCRLGLGAPGDELLKASPVGAGCACPECGCERSRPRRVLEAIPVWRLVRTTCTASTGPRTGPHQQPSPTAVPGGMFNRDPCSQVRGARSAWWRTPGAGPGLVKSRTPRDVIRNRSNVAMRSETSHGGRARGSAARPVCMAYANDSPAPSVCSTRSVPSTSSSIVERADRTM